MLEDSMPVINDKALSLITEIRTIRNSKGLSPTLAFDVYINTDQVDEYKIWEYTFCKLLNS
jgi:hypothetical protein